MLPLRVCCVCALISAVDHDGARAVGKSTDGRSETSGIPLNDHRGRLNSVERWRRRECRVQRVVVGHVRGMYFVPILLLSAPSLQPPLQTKNPMPIR